MKVLSKKEFNDIITWMPSGKSFNIINSKRFTAEILPEYFKSAKYSSFTRKLHRWGFIRHYRGEEAGAFFHKNFQKARFDLVEKMTCCKQEPPKSSMAIAAAAAAEPVPPQQITTATHTPLLRPIAQPPVLAAAAPAAPVVGLDAAIEIEVARRVQERIDAAALRRFAMIRQEQQMMQEHDFLQRQEQQLLRQQHERQMQQQLAQEQQLKATLVSAWSQPRIELLKRTAALAVNPKPAPLPARNFGSRPADLPETNIYSAKTA